MQPASEWEQPRYNGVSDREQQMFVRGSSKEGAERRLRSQQ